MLHKLSPGQGCPSKEHIFGHVTSLIGENIIAAYSEKFPRATANTCQIYRFLRLTQKFKMASKSGRKTIFWKSWQ